MLSMKYINTSRVYDVDFEKISNHIISITGNIPVKTNGFILSRKGKEDNWNYSKYKTIYRELGNTILFSDDGSVYVEPEPIPLPPEPEPEPEPYVPTEEELKVIFEANKQNKINESKLLLGQYLETHPLLSYCHNQDGEFYNVTAEKQALMTSNYMSYQIAKQAGIDAVLTWNATGKECEVWTEEEYVQLILEATNYVHPLVSLQQSYEVNIANCETQEELDEIIISFDIQVEENTEMEDEVE